MKKNKIKTKKPVAVLQVLPHLNSGGLVSGAVEIAFALKTNNFTSIIASSGGYRENEIYRASSILENMPVDRKSPLTILKNKNKIIELVKKYSVNIIHARSRAPAWSSYLAAKELNIPFVTTFHGTYGTENFLKKKYNSVMLKGDKIIAISEFIKKHIKTEYNYENNVVVVPRGVNTSIFSPKSVTSARIINAAKKIKVQEDEKIILMPARLTDWKGHKLAIRAISSLANKKFKLVLMGDVQNKTNYKKKLIKLADKLNVLSNTIFLENTRDMPAYLKLSDLVISCSTKPEAFGRTILEAQAMGKSVVAFNHGGAIELITNNENGILSKVGDVKDLSNNIDKVLSYSNNKRKIIASNSIRNVNKKYLTEYMCEKTIDVYKELLKKHSYYE